MQHNQRVKAVLLLGGTGQRFGSSTPKQFHRLAGKKIYLHTLEQLLHSRLFEQIVLVCPQGWREEIAHDTAAYPEVAIAEGGNSRQQSSFQGLLACGKETDIVLIHDAVRPFVSQEILKRNVEEAIRTRAVDTCIPSADTLVHAPEGTRIACIPARNEYLRGQTPQTFSYPLILQAHLLAQSQGFIECSDDCTLVMRLNHPVHVVTGEESNLKITSELDLILAEQLLRLHRHTTLPSSESLRGKRYAITGGTGGIGQAIAQALKEEGAEVVCVARSAPEFAADLTSFAATQNVFNSIYQKYGPLDGLINGMGLLKMKQLDELSPEEIDLLISTNLSGTIYACKCAHLKENGHILNIASSSYIRGKKNYAIYSGAKAAIVNFTQGLAEEKEQLRINAIVPQRANTPMRTAHFPEEDPGTLLSPEQIAKEIASILKNPFLTGAIIEIRNK